IVTVLFCELDAEESVDPESLRRVTTRFLDAAASIVAGHGGRLDQLVGGDVMAVFGVPLVRGDDGLRAARSALELRDLGQRSPDGLRTRIALSTGEVVIGTEGDVTGAAIAAGKRLARITTWGEIALSEATHVLVAHAVDADRRKGVYQLAS